MVVRSIETIDSHELKTLLSAIKEAYGYDFTQYAEASINRRSLYFMNAKNFKTVRELQEALIQNDQLFEEFVRNLSVTVTEMFRDPAFYLTLRNKVMKRLATYPFIRIWVAGCATGEEVYSIAILLKEEGLLSRSLIYATDINQHSLVQAKQAIFFFLQDGQRFFTVCSPETGQSLWLEGAEQRVHVAIVVVGDQYLPVAQNFVGLVQLADDALLFFRQP